MALNFTFKFGSLDLSQYVRVGPQDSLDIYGNGWESPVFSQSPSGQGQPLVNIDVANREMIWPLFLKAVTKDALNALKVQVQREIRYGVQPLRVEWRGPNASASTFYEVAFARLDERTNYRLDEHNWTDVSLRAWCQPPYGYGSTGAITVGSAAGAGHIARTSLASLGGDVDADLMFTGTPSLALFRPDQPVHALCAVIPATNWSPYTTAGSLAAIGGGGTLIGASGAAGSQVWRLQTAASSVVGQQQANDALTNIFSTGTWNPDSDYYGRIRRLAVVRVAATYGVTLYVGRQAVATVVPSYVNEWTLVDLGLSSSDSVSITARHPSGLATTTVDINAIINVPENRTSLRVYGGSQAGGHTMGTLTSAADGFRWGLTDLDNVAYQVGETPRGRPGLKEQVVYGLFPLGDQVPQNFGFGFSIAARERFTFAK